LRLFEDEIQRDTRQASVVQYFVEPCIQAFWNQLNGSR
jgi:hypothetical protein